MTDTYLYAASATVLAVDPVDDPKEPGKRIGWAVVLDATCFHPQGGGQPADTGTISDAMCREPFAVSMVKKDASGVVRHEGAAEPAFAVGAKVALQVDGEARMKNARVHSAGHLIDVAMVSCGVKLRPTKGYHFTPGAYVEYDGKLEAAEREALLPKLQAAMDALIGKGCPTQVVTVDGVRVVHVGGQGCPCGGTHVNDVAELKVVTVEAVKSKGKVTRVSYSLSD